MVQDFLLEESFFQLIKQYTHSEKVRGGTVSRSCLDHVYTNAPGKCDTPKVESAGDSDHLAVIFNKYSSELKIKPQTIQKRSYKFFVVRDFLTKVSSSEINAQITVIDDLGEILDHHAPVRTFQIHKPHIPNFSWRRGMG